MAPKPLDIGTLFAVPLRDSTYALGQVVGREPALIDSVTCAFYRIRIASEPLASTAQLPSSDDLIAVHFVTKDLLTKRVWKVIGKFPVALAPELFPHEDKRSRGWVGARVIGSGIIVHFLNAYFGLEPWFQMQDPHYFDHLLLRPDMRPEGLGLSS